MEELLGLSDGMPERVLEVDEVLLAEGDQPDDLYVLVEGAVVVRRNGDDVITLDQPGACIGEKAVLLGRPHRSSVVAVAPTRVRVLADAATHLRDHPAVLHGVAVLLAARLDMAEAFVGDLRHQYRDHDGGLGMVGDVLGELAHHHGDPVSPGSQRDPDPLY